MPSDPAPSVPLSDRLTRLARVTSELVRAETIEDVSQAVVDHGAKALEAHLASMSLANADGTTARLVAISGGRPDDPVVYGTFPIHDRIPSAECIRTGERLTLTAADIDERYPEVEERGLRTAVALPLRILDRTIGSILLSFTEERRFDDAEIEFLDILADTCAQGLDRIAAKQDAARQSEKLAFLAEAADELSSLDYETTLANVARLAVPSFADWSAIDLVEDGAGQVAVHRVDHRVGGHLVLLQRPVGEGAGGGQQGVRTPGQRGDVRVSVGGGVGPLLLGQGDQRPEVVGGTRRRGGGDAGGRVRGRMWRRAGAAVLTG